MKELLQARVPKQTVVILNEISDETGASVSEHVRRAIEDYIQKMLSSHNTYTLLRERKVEYSVTKANGEQQEEG